MNLKEPFIGTSELISGEIGEDLSYYYGVSEQTPTIVALGVLSNNDGTVRQAGGFIIQLLPNASEEAYQFLENFYAQKPINYTFATYDLTKVNQVCIETNHWEDIIQHLAQVLSGFVMCLGH